MHVVSPLDGDRWSWDGAERRVESHLGREAVLLSSVEGAHVATVLRAELEDGVVEVDVSIPDGRSFHGVAWRALGFDYESSSCAHRRPCGRGGRRAP